MSRFILDKKSFLCCINAAKRSLKSRGWGLEMTQDKDNPCHWIIWNIVDGYWVNVIEKVGDAYISNDLVCDIELDDDLEDEFRWLCMRDAAEVLEEGIKNYLETMNNALKKL